jgi:hypothetical protein
MTFPGGEVWVLGEQSRGQSFSGNMKGTRAAQSQPQGNMGQNQNSRTQRLAELDRTAELSCWGRKD